MTKGDAAGVKRTPVAALVLPDVALTTPLRAGLEALATARPLDLEVLGTEPIPGARYATVSRWGASVRLAARWVRGPRASRPHVVMGVGPTGGAVAVRVAPVLGVRSVVWTGALCGAVPKETLQRASEVWGLDDAEVRRLAGLGVRAVRALLTPPANEVTLAPPPDQLGRLAVLGVPDLQHPLVEAIRRAGRGLEVALLTAHPGRVGLDSPLASRAPDPSTLLSAWPEAKVRVVDLHDQVARRAQMAWACGVASADPELHHAWLTEALLLGRPLLVPRMRLPPVFSSKAGFSFGNSSESASDALAELWSATERKLFDGAHLRELGASVALEAVVDELVARLAD